MKKLNLLIVLSSVVLINTYSTSAQEVTQKNEIYKVERYDHLVLQTDNFKETVNWYKDILGFTKTTQQRTPVKNTQLESLKLGDFKLDILSGNNRKEVLKNYNMSIESYKYELSGIMSIEVSDMEKTIKKLNEKDIAIIMGPYTSGITNTTSIDIRDNNGNEIRFNKYLR